MSHPESSPVPHDERPKAHQSGELPPELAAFLRDHEYACVTETTNLGTVVIIKMPSADIESLRGPVPIQLRHELYAHPASPVVRMVFAIYDQPDAPLMLETFINIADTVQRGDYVALANQRDLPLIFYDEAVEQRLSKVVALTNQEEIQRIGYAADRLLESIPEGARDFELAKSRVVAANPL